MTAFPRWALCWLMLAVATGAGTPSVCIAGAEDADSQPRWRRFTLIASAGPLIGGPATGLARQLEEAGFDDVSPGFWFPPLYLPPLAYPRENDNSASLALTARFALTRAWALGAGFASTDLGGATGYRSDPADPAASGDWVESAWTGELFWVTAFWTPVDWLRMGAGPGAYFLTSEGLGPTIHESRFGATFEAGAVSPNLGWVVFDISARFHWIPAADVQSSTYPEGATITLRPEWTHVEIAFGVGIRR